ncbi:TlpA disulfide reductase family protein [Rapidithrix thailandica]|uniref:TlpA disulfide reductase family protein n=1 Tax=Rapidithrix thailandica TaxID=413964 RepID=A0AAW9SBS4_9BACT
MSTKKKIFKELRNLGITIVLLAILYFTGWHTTVIGTLQRGVLYTGLMNPDLDTLATPASTADYDFQLQNMDGELLDFQSLKGKTIFMNFWATWCPPCIAEMPSIHQLYQKLETQENIVFVMLSVDEDSEKLRKFLANKAYDFPVYQLTSPLPAIYQSNSIPTTFVISPEGKVVLKHEKMADYSTEKFYNYLKDL